MDAAGPPSGAFAPTKYKEDFMEAERINAIGTTLADLAERVDDLRGYL